MRCQLLGMPECDSENDPARQAPMPLTKMQLRLRAARRATQSAENTLARAKKMRDRAKADKAALVAQTLDGLNPEKRRKLIAAQRRAESDPKAQAMLARAEVEKRVRDKRKEMGIGQVVPEMMLGEPISPESIPMSVAQRRAQKTGKKA